MNILVLSNLFPPNVIGGYERLCAEVAQGLVRAGHAVTVLTSDHGPPVTTPDPFPVLRRLRLLADRDDIYRPFEASAGTRQAIEAENADVLARTVESVRPDLVFVWNLFFLGSSLLAGLDAAPVPSVVFLTDNWLIAAETPERIAALFDAHVHSARPFTGEGAFPLDHLLRHTAIFGAAFVQRLYRHCGFGFAREAVAHNGVRLPLPAEAVPVARRELRRQGELRLLFAGRLVELKGPQDAVAALPTIQAGLPPGLTARLTLVGDTQDRAFHNALMRQIEATGQGDQIAFAPQVPTDELASLFEDHDIYLFPSRYEPFALTLIHALAAGIPTVASDAGGDPEIVLHGRTGLLFPVGDVAALARCVLDLADDGERRQRLALRGRRLANRFTFERMMGQIEQVLSQAG